MNGGPSVWAITPEERDKHDQKFDTLSPSMGYVSGEHARKFFLQSGLPASVLAEIWALADMNRDGKMDRLEFSIAMKLIKLKLQGTPLPSALPIIMKQPPVPVPSLKAPTSSMINPAYGIGSVSNMPLAGTNLAMLTPISMATLGLSPLTPMTALAPLVPTATGLNPLIAPTPTRPLMPTMGNATLPNGSMGILHPIPAGALATGLPLSASTYTSPIGLSSSPACVHKASSLLDLGTSSSASSSPSVVPPMVAPSDWAVPHASRLKYRQQFNSLDKQMTGFLTGQQVRGAMATTLLTQTQLASIWTLADVDKDGKLRAEEFILAMHLIDMAKSGQPLPLTLPTELVPPSQRGTVNGSSSSLYAALTDDLDIEPPQKAKTNLSFEDKFKANLERGKAELEKRRLALQEAERREHERRSQKEREEREKREREAQEAEERRRKEEERRLERQRELERQKEEERQREIEKKEAAQRELERQRKEERERRMRGELQIKREQEQDDIIRLKAKKRSLEMELEAVGNKHRQISHRLRDIQNKKKLQRTELDLTSQRKETRQQDINNLHKQLEEFQRKLSQLTPEQKRLTEKLKNRALNNLPVSTTSTLKGSVSEKRATCLKLREQLDALEKDTAAKLAEMDQYNKDKQYVGPEDSMLQAIFCLLACLRNLFYLLKELKESQRKQQAALEKLQTIKEDKLHELIRRKEQEEERRRREEERKQQEERRRKEEEEAQRRIKMEKERQWQEKLRRDEEARQRRLQEEREAKKREEEENERQALIRAAKEQAERELRAKEEAERRKREAEERRRQEEERRKLEEERRQLEEERRKLEEERRKEEKRRKEEEEDRHRREEERKQLEEERREEERRREREEEERRRQRAAEAAIRDAEERRNREEQERRKREEQERRKREEQERRKRDEERRKQEEERKRVEEERKRKEEEAERRKAEERQRNEEASRQQQQPSGGGKLDIQEKLTALLRGLEERKGGQPRAIQHRKSAALTSFRALYPFTARNNEELSFNADDIIEVDETTEREEGWLYGSKQGKMGWFPESYVERISPSDMANNNSAAAPKVPLQSQLSNALEVAKAAGTKSAFTPTQSPNLAPSETQGQEVVGNLLGQALCSWTAKTDNHLNFNKDDVIQVLEQQENWWLGELNGERGWFPKTYVKLLGEEDSSDMKSSTPDALESSDSLQLEEYVALYTYESPEPGDLTFREGDLILVSKRDGEWWNGSLGDRAGVFPSNYVKPKEIDTSSTSAKKKPEIGQVIRAHSSTGPDQLNLENGKLILILGKNTSGWWLGELQARGKKRQKGWFPASNVKLLGSNSGKSTPAPQPVCQVIAIYDYTAANKDEMSFSKGQLINVLDKNDPDWWKGEINGVTGLFPTNYVKMTTADCDPSQQWR